MPDLSLVAALARNRVIGKDGQLPWRLPNDLRRFKELTLGHAVIMGRKTYDSIVQSLGRPLPGRDNIVLTRSAGFQCDGCIPVVSVDDALREAHQRRPGAEVFVIGGAEIYRLTLPRATRLYMTELDDDFDGDTFFPGYDASQWREEARERSADGALNYSFVTYVRRRESSAGAGS
jgi:dihydrofolate reductase